MFLAEKGIDNVDIVQVDLGNKEQLSDNFRAINPSCIVPALALDDGTLITESVAICRYFEELQPSPPLMGRDAKEKALVEMWQRRVELQGMLPAGDTFRNSGKRWTDRALAGPVNYAQIPELVNRGRARVEYFLGVLNEQLGVSEFVATETFTIADITAFILIEFAGWSKIEIPEDYGALQHWYQSTKARPSVKV
jgi:glutathione S-transferase